jgi:hypothetical protein
MYEQPNNQLLRSHQSEFLIIASAPCGGTANAALDISEGDPINK